MSLLQFPHKTNTGITLAQNLEKASYFSPVNRRTGFIHDTKLLQDRNSKYLQASGSFHPQHYWSGGGDGLHPGHFVLGALRVQF